MLQLIKTDHIEMDPTLNFGIIEEQNNSLDQMIDKNGMYLVQKLRDFYIAYKIFGTWLVSVKISICITTCMLQPRPLSNDPRFIRYIYLITYTHQSVLWMYSYLVGLEVQCLA